MFVPTKVDEHIVKVVQTSLKKRQNAGAEILRRSGRNSNVYSCRAGCEPEGEGAMQERTLTNGPHRVVPSKTMFQQQFAILLVIFESTNVDPFFFFKTRSGGRVWSRESGRQRKQQPGDVFFDLFADTLQDQAQTRVSSDVHVRVVRCEKIQSPLSNHSELDDTDSLALTVP